MGPRGRFRAAPRLPPRESVVSFAPRPDWFASVRNFEFRVYHEHLSDLHNRLLTRETGLQLLGVVYDSGDRFDLRRNVRFEQLDAPFDIHPGVVLPVGKYTFDDWELRPRARATAGCPAARRSR